MRKVSLPGLLPVILCVLVLSLAAPLAAQVTFQRTYGGEGWDSGRSVAQTADGGYVIIGSTCSLNTYYSDVYLVKTNAFGDTMWTRVHGDTLDDYGYSVVQTTDGGYIFTGGTGRPGGFCPDVWLVKTDAWGDTVWTQTWGDWGSEVGYSVIQTSDGGYAVTGHSAGDRDAWLIKTDTNGDTMWTRAYGGEETDCGYSVAQTTDGGYVIAGWTWSYGAGDNDIWLIRTDSAGDTIWTRTWGDVDSDWGRSVAQTADGGFVVTGYTEFFCNYNAWLIKTDADGDTVWTRTFGNEEHEDESWSVQQTSDGGYIVVGTTCSFGGRDADVWLIKTDAWGDTVWTRVFDEAENDFGYSVRQTTDGGYIIAGYTESFGAGESDVWLIKTDSAGNVAIAEPQPPVAHKPAPATIVRGVLLCPVWSAMTPSLRNVSDIALHNAAGRKVMDLQPGPNDVRHLSPGVYFVRPAGTRGKGSSRKVILTR